MSVPAIEQICKIEFQRVGDEKKGKGVFPYTSAFKHLIKMQGFSGEDEVRITNVEVWVKDVEHYFDKYGIKAGAVFHLYALDEITLRLRKIAKRIEKTRRDEERMREIAKAEGASVKERKELKELVENLQNVLASIQGALV